MKRVFRFRVFIFIVIALLISAITLISVNTGGNPGIMTNAMTTLTKPLKSVSASIVKTFESIYGYINAYDKVVAENETLKDEIAKLQQDYRETTDILNENNRLRALLDLSSRHPEYDQYDTATVISWGSSNWSSSFTIGKGSLNSNIKVGDCVITEMGDLIGVVSVVEPSASTVLTILDTTFSVGAYIERNDERAIAMGDFSLMREGFLKFDYLTDTTEINAGDTIITSGKGGILPAGLVIGEVKEVVTNDTGISRYAVISPAVDLESLSDVYLITSFSVPGDEN